jgi:hypothetical protein
MIIKNKYATFLGHGFAGKFGVWAQKWTQPDAPAAANVLAAVTLGDGVTTTKVVADFLVQPDFPRALSITGNQTQAKSVVITGTDIRGKVITDTIVLNNTDTVIGIKAFKTITSILFPSRTAGGDTVTVGFSDKLGLEMIPFYAVAISAHHNGVLEGTLPTVTRHATDISQCLADFNSACAADHDQAIVFYTTDRPNKLSRTS